MKFIHIYIFNMYAVNPRMAPLVAYLFFGFLHGGLVDRRAYSGGLKCFLVGDHIPFEIVLPIAYFLMLQKQAI